MSVFSQIHQYMKKKPLKSFLIIVVSLLLGYYIYTKFFKNEHMEKTEGSWGVMWWISYSSFVLIFGLIIPFIVMYFIVKSATRNVFKEFNLQTLPKSQ
jgi:hypothetical protein